MNVSERLHGEKYRVMPYENVLREVRAFVTDRYSRVLAEIIDKDAANDMVTEIIEKYLSENGIRAIETNDTVELVKRLYNDMSKYGVITEYIGDKSVEEINCNAYNDIEIITADGFRKLDAAYSSPSEIRDYAKKIMQIGGITLDESAPIGDGYITTGIRASAIVPPCVDDDIGAALFIRQQRMANITQNQYLQNNTATPEELDTIENFIRYGVSTVFAGAIGTGKTTDMNYFLRLLPPDKGIFVIEDTRELNLVKKNAAGNIISRVVHTKTRKSDDPQKNISMNDLLRVGLRSNAQYLIPSEMRDEAAMTAQEAGRTGQVVVTSLHSNGARETYRRIMTMCRMSGTKLDDNMLLDMIIEAFPIVVYKKKLADKTRKIMEVFEALGRQDGDVCGNTLYRYRVTDNIYRGDTVVRVEGVHQKVHPISDALARRMLESGAPLSVVRHMAADGWNPAKEVIA